MQQVCGSAFEVSISLVAELFQLLGLPLDHHFVVIKLDRVYIDSAPLWVRAACTKVRVHCVINCPRVLETLLPASFTIALDF